MKMNKKIIKLNFSEIENTLTREEMKNVMAGSGVTDCPVIVGCLNDGDCSLDPEAVFHNCMKCKYAHIPQNRVCCQTSTCADNCPDC